MSEKEDREIIVSVIVPIRNEEKHIDKCIKSILNQDYPLENVEVIFVDGLSQDRTKDIINKYAKQCNGIIKLFDNPHKTVPYAMNIGINNSVGKYIVRLDAHSEYSNEYISSCISTLEQIDADNVGGLAITKGHGFIGDCFSKVLSSKFGVGNSGFRTNASSGYVDTVPFGVFKKEAFMKYGLYDERLTRNQDYELNYRIRKSGGRIYLNSNIKLIYYCRDTIPGIVKQSYENGKWNVITSKLCPGSMSIRHFIPLAFIISLITLPVLALFNSVFIWMLLLELGLYTMLDTIFSIKIASNWKQILLLILLFPLLHLSYGIGSLMGIVNAILKI